MTHTIKLNERFCDAVLERRKTFEVRYNDRGYQTGDRVRFEAVDDDGVSYYKRYGRYHPIDFKTYEITFILSGWGIEKDYVAFSIREVDK